ncbi:MAG: DsbA family oxidoreductase [Longimicrobiales bacterium]
MLEDQNTLFFFDYVDPGSYLASVLVDDVSPDPDGPPPLDFRGFEVRVPPAPRINPTDPDWLTYQQNVTSFAEAMDVELTPPAFVPWTRKAHELGAHAKERDCYPGVRSALFRAHFIEGLDIGRIDVLVDIAASSGLDRSETKAALDVDRYTEVVESDRAMGEERNVIGVPTFVRGVKRLEGLRSPDEIRSWMQSLHPHT